MDLGYSFTYGMKLHMVLWENVFQLDLWPQKPKEKKKKIFIKAEQVLVMYEEE